ncbi:MAG: MoaD/ThiS family protein [Desulfobacteraceae bacterium]|uniref:MoaD/ThiS family protein n=1 Tax=Candidatus Desulfacyla euxinica TaxID=2841693 RepID=A0A8J6TAK7_9DELT|nr:MoaD/ThiS family protein [Candidatus Desulfacyla euxinica]MBL6977469.1 MoaD/ThiS family protein [Desulfobacteraceae bacterium]
MPDRNKTISVTVRLFTGLDRDAREVDQNPRDGITFNLPKGTRLRRLTKELDLPDRYSLAYFVNGKQAGLLRKLKEGDEIACLRPSAGG